jgi:hypothetical protein
LAVSVGHAKRPLWLGVRRCLKRRPLLTAFLAAGSVALLVLAYGGWQTADRHGATEQSDTGPQQVRSVSLVQRAYDAWRDSQVARAEALLEECSQEQRRWEWHYVKYLCQPGTDQEPLTLTGNNREVTSVAFSPDGNWVAGGSDQTVKVWDAATGLEIHTFKGHPHRVTSLAFSLDGLRLASARFPMVKVWDTTTGEETLTLKDSEGCTSVAFNPNGTRLASGSWGDHSVRVWDAGTGRQMLTLRGHTKGVSSVAFSPDGKRLASASEDWTVRLWDASTGDATLTLTGHTDAVRSVTFSSDGEYLASAGADQTVRVWDVSTGRRTLTLQVGHSPANPGAFRAAATGQETLLAPEAAGAVRSVAFSLDGQRLASGGMELKILDAATGQEMLTLPGPTRQVLCVAFSPDGQRLASGSADQTVRVWDWRPITPAARVERDALRLVRKLFDEPLDRPVIPARVRADPKLSPPLRRKALALVETWPVHPERLNEESWSVVRWPGAEAVRYERALRQAQIACRLAPQNTSYLTTLGLAQYRTGRYADAVGTLTRSDQLQGGKEPATVAVLTMARHRLGHKDQATALARLRELRHLLLEVLKQGPDAGRPIVPSEEALRLAGEAERLLQPPADSGQ